MIEEAKVVLRQDPIFSKILHIDIEIPQYDGDVNAYLYSSIVSQQLSTKAAGAIYGRFLGHFDGSSPSPDMLLGTDKDTLRNLGLSRSKTNYLQNVAYFFQSDRGKWKSKTDEEVIKELTSIKGVGVWTVQMVLIFCLGRRDVFPILDLGVRNSAIDLFQLKGDKKEINARLIKIAEAWKPYRSIASLYLWAWRNMAVKQ